MSTSYKGMRWLKCDLQMQTPADTTHWRGPKLTPGGEADAAKLFAEACYETKLDVVGITDHNFLSKYFLPYLQSAFDNLEREHGHKITLFPGFEFEADVGKGIHVLCLFEPGTSLEDIDHILTECGVGMPRSDNGKLSKSTKRLPEILSIVQRRKSDGTWRGIVIIPHIFDDSLFDNDRLSEWLQQEEFRNEDLFAVEVPKPITQMSQGFQNLFRSGDNCHEEWKRIRPIATIMSSDSKKYVERDDDGRPVPNSIGYRYTWVKMSMPSIESLRQAFLDQESRIILPDDVATDIHPSKKEVRSRIDSITIKNAAFLADQVVHFSNGMNCIIGGRGSGKSSLLEYLRIAFRKDRSESLDKGTQERIQRVRNTLNESGAEIEVRWKSADDVEDHIQWKGGNSKVVGRDLLDPDTFFDGLPIRFYSQQELNQLTASTADGGGGRQAQRLLELVDGFSSDELEDLADQERKVKNRISSAFLRVHERRSQEREKRRLEQEFRDLERQWKARREIQQHASRHQLLKAESRYLKEVGGTPGKTVLNILSQVNSFLESHVPFQFEDSPHAKWFKEFDEKVLQAKRIFAQSISCAAEQFENTLDELKTGSLDWAIIERDLEQADDEFAEACKTNGLTVEDVGRLQDIDALRVKKKAEIEEIDRSIQYLADNADEPENLMSALHQIWMKQYTSRQLAAKMANVTATRKNGQGRFIEVSATFQRDRKSYSKLWTSFAPSDGRTKLGRIWEDLGQDLYKQFCGQESVDSPWQLLHNWLFGGASIEIPRFEEYRYEFDQHVQQNQDRWEELRMSRVEDVVDMTLFNEKDMPTGSIAEGTLSDGQRNTAVLALLLAQQGGPLIIDQPEDELDSHFLYRELIPLLRSVKRSRQLILSTHNANLPVNGDAELVYSFEANDNKGQMRVQGGLDNPQVTKAIMDIMEGTEEAFRRRQEKYNY